MKQRFNAMPAVSINLAKLVVKANLLLNNETEFPYFPYYKVQWDKRLVSFNLIANAFVYRMSHQRNKNH